MPMSAEQKERCEEHLQAVALERGVMCDTQFVETEGEDEEEEFSASAMQREEHLRRRHEVEDEAHSGPRHHHHHHHRHRHHHHHHHHHNEGDKPNESAISPSHSNPSTSPLPGWLLPFAEELERQSETAPCDPATGDVICFESVEIPDVSITRYIAILYSHFRDLTAWAACITLVHRIEAKGCVAVNAYTVHRLTLATLAVALYKTQPYQGDLTMPAGPGGVDEEDLSSMIRVLVRALDCDLSLSLDEMQRCLEHTSPKRTPSLDFAVALLATSPVFYEREEPESSVEPIRRWVTSCSPATSQHDLPMTEPTSSPRHVPLHSSGSGVKFRLKRISNSVRRMLRRTISASTSLDKLSK